MQKLIDFEFFPCIKLTQSLKLYNFNKCVIVMSSNFLKNDMSPCLCPINLCLVFVCMLLC